MIIPCKNRIQNSNFRLLGWNIRAGLGHNYNQGNLCGGRVSQLVSEQKEFLQQHLLPYHVLSAGI